MAPLNTVPRERPVGVVWWPAVCGGEDGGSRLQALWDNQLTVNTTNPNLTPCFQHSVLVWAPCALLWVCVPLYMSFLNTLSYPSWKPLRFADKGSINTAKLIVGFFLSALAVLRLIKVQVDGSNGSSVPLAEYIAPTLELTTFIMVCALMHMEFRKGIVASPVLCAFWLSEVIANIPTLKWKIDSTIIQGYPDDVFTSRASIIHFSLLLVQLILHLRADLPRRTRHRASPGKLSQKTFPAKCAYAENPLLYEKCSQENYSSSASNKRSPEETASLLPLVSYWWMGPLIIKGFKNPLAFDHLPDILPADRCSAIVARFTDALKNIKERRKSMASTYPGSGGEKQSGEPDMPGITLFWPLIRSNRQAFYMVGSLRFLTTFTEFANPQLLGLLIAYISTPGTHSWMGYMVAMLYFLNNILHQIISQSHIKYRAVFAMRTRNALLPALFRKAMRLSSTSRRSRTGGEIVNLMSVDAERIVTSMSMIHEYWILFLFTGLSMYFIWQRVGVASLTGFVILIAFAPMNGLYFHKKNRQLQKQQMSEKDGRIKLLTQVLTSIKVLKLYAWEPSFSREISFIRSKELDIMKKQTRLRVLIRLCWTAVPYLVAISVFGTYVLIPGNVLDSSKAFVSLSLIDVLNYSVAVVPVLITSATESYVSMNRVASFLFCDEIDPDGISHYPTIDAALHMEGCYYSWSLNGPSALKSINLKVAHGELLAVVGQVGCGKSSLISAMLGEMHKLCGSVNVLGSTAYVPQQAWIQSTTLRNNILFSKAYNRCTYCRVVDACALRRDFQVLPAGDTTEIGEKGINLSGGQKQRISLARAVYQDCDVYLLDDPLSAVDSHVGKQIFNEVIGPSGLLRNKTRILVTHGITYLPYVDRIIVMKDGGVSEIGSYKELLQSNGPFAEFINTYVNMQESGNVDDDPHRDRDTKKKPHVDADTSSYAARRDMRRAEHKCRKNRDSLAVLIGQEGDHKHAVKGKLISEEETESGAIKWTVVKSYVKAHGCCNLVSAILAYIIFTGTNVGSSIWLSQWTDDAHKNLTGIGRQHQTNLRLTIYGVFGLVLVPAKLGLAASVLLGGIRAAGAIHDTLLNRILRAPMMFFDTTPLGRITTRFTKDMDKIDSNLPTDLCAFIISSAPVIGLCFVMSYSTRMLLVVIMPVLAFCLILQRLYNPAIRQLRRIGAMRHTPIYVHFDESFSGVSCIRAFGQEQQFIDKNDKLCDDSQIANYACMVGHRWVAFNLEFLGNIVILFASLFTVMQRDVITGGLAGLSVSYAAKAYKSFSSMIQVSVLLQHSMVPLERINEYTKKPVEAPWVLEANRPSKSWPTEGHIVVDDYSTRYRPGLDLVLKSINFEIKGGEKVGIVGRTGAGKSSLTSALFRIMEKSKGTILIDNQDISTIGLHDLRSKLTIIPQDPVLFSGSIRLNLDPFQKYTDQELWKALSHSYLEKFVAGLREELGYECGDGGEALSVGQKQLICLARALLRKTKILVLDEATAAVDLETDDLIQRTIRTEFKDCTVITIAHRLNTIIDYDRVMVLDRGEVREFAPPGELLQQQHSAFYGMAKEAGVI